MKKLYLIFLILLASFFNPPKAESQNGFILLNEYLPWANAGCGPRQEFVELLNFGPGPVNIGCYVITDGDFAVTIPPNTIVLPGDFFVLSGMASMPSPCGNIDSAVTVDLNWGTCSCTSGTPISLLGMMSDGGFANEQIVLLDPLGNVVDAVVRDLPQETASLLSKNTMAGQCAPFTFDLDLMPIVYERIGESAGRGNSFGRKVDGDCGWLKTPPQSANAPNNTRDDNPSLFAQLQIIKAHECFGTGGSVSVSFNGPMAGVVFPLKYILAFDRDSNNVFTMTDTYVNGSDNTAPTLDFTNLAAGHYKLAIMPGSGCNYKVLEFYILPCNAVVLPATIADFAVNCSIANRQLVWRSNQSDHIAYFEVQSSTLNEPYTNIGKIYPANTGNIMQQFTFVDESKNRNQAFYRMKITGKDGSVVYSYTVSCNSKPNANLVVYPNPVKAEVKMQLTSLFKEEANVFILASDGRRVKNSTVVLKKGLNEINIPVLDLAPGSYVVRFASNQQMISSKFVKN
jgi:hypothetical protein